MTILVPHTGISSLAASRLQRWALLLSAHSYNIKYRKSDSHCNTDGLSRLPLPVTKPESNTVDIFYLKEVEKAPVSTVQVKKETRIDPDLSAVMDIIFKGQPAGDNANLKPFLGRRLELSVQSGCLLWGRRVTSHKSVAATSFRAQWNSKNEGNSEKLLLVAMHEQAD